MTATTATATTAQDILWEISHKLDECNLDGGFLYLAIDSLHDEFNFQDWDQLITSELIEAVGVYLPEVIDYILDKTGHQDKDCNSILSKDTSEIVEDKIVPILYRLQKNDINTPLWDASIKASPSATALVVDSLLIENHICEENPFSDENQPTGLLAHLKENPHQIDKLYSDIPNEISRIKRILGVNRSQPNKQLAPINN